MKKAGPITTSDALRVGFFELAVVVVGLVFVRKEIYLTGKLASMVLHWQEYTMLVLMFIDGVIRGYGELSGQGDYMSPFRKKMLRFVLPFMLFLFVSCSSLCDKVHAACFQEEWWRDIGVVILAAGVALSAWAQRTQPAELIAPVGASIVGMDETTPPVDATAGGSLDPEAVITEAATTEAATTEAATTEAATTEAATTEAATTEAANTESTTKGIADSSTAEQDSVNELELEAGGTPALPGVKPDAPLNGVPSNTAGSDASAGTDASTESDAPSSEIVTSGPWNWIRYPGRAFTLVELVGISLTLSAWMPLITIPGLFVLFKWELADLEAYRISQFGQKYLNYKKHSWYLIPYIW